MKYKRFVYHCSPCEGTGLQRDAQAAYKVRVCEACGGAGRRRMTVREWIELNRKGSGRVN